ncbi:MAG: gamma carbonic anhydrase family protein [Selenomonadaceae bacterium]|nr:gamma carbonic anhydrase family protein [Selenomonadaceae bacterium]
MQGIVLSYKGKKPKIADNVFVAPNCSIVGDVKIGTGSSIWFGAAVRGDFQPVTIGVFTNIQDNATVHVMGDVPTEIGNYVTIGHNALVHCRSIGNNTLIGMGSIILGYSEIGENCIIGAGTLLPQYKKIPNNCLVFGNPAKIMRAIRDDELEALRASAMQYHDCAREYIQYLSKRGMFDEVD